MEVTHSTAEINGQLLVKRKMMFHTAKPQIQPIYDEQTIHREVYDSSKLVGDGPLIKRFGSDPDMKK